MPPLKEQFLAEAKLKLCNLVEQNKIPPGILDLFSSIKIDRKHAPVKIDDILAAIIEEDTGAIIFLIEERIQGPPLRTIAFGARHGRKQNPMTR